MLLCRKHEWQNDDERAVHLLGVRAYNTGSAALKLALSGFHQAASHLTRDLLETTNLLDYFSIEPAKIAEWRTADEKGLKRFAPVEIRRALEGHPRFIGQRRDIPYKQLSTYAAHPSHEGFRMLLTSQEQFEVGPFFDEEFLRGWLLQTAAWLGEGTLAFMRNLPTLAAELQTVRSAFAEQASAWGAKYLTKPQV